MLRIIKLKHLLNNIGNCIIMVLYVKHRSSSMNEFNLGLL